MAGPLRVSAADPARHDRAVVPLAGASLVDATPACAACGVRTARPRFAIEDLAAQLVVCTACGTGRLHPMPDEDEIASFYPAAYYGDAGAKFRGPIEWLVRALGARHARFLAEGLAPGARVLDLGCGRGVTLAALAEQGFEAHGVERSAEAARGADRRAQVRIAPTLVEAGYPAGHFDAVVVWHVLEHLRAPDAALAEIRRVLRPGGRLVVAVPNFASWQARWAAAAWFHLDPPRHLHHFPLAALRGLLARSGFAVASEHHFSLRQNPFGWIQSALNRWPGLPRNGLYALLYQRGAGVPPPFDARTRALLWAALLLGAVPALALSCAETVARAGATVHVVARARA
jgi:2-polyprenyl-3-methyl-5-hydroxy-6-metoxy-1,4-benzoquinol methylase